MTALIPIAGATVLIVDDMPAMLVPIAAALEEVGIHVLVAQDGREALHRTRLTRPDLVLLDVMMPELDGIEVCRLLKEAEETADIPVILMTGMAEQADSIRGFEAGAVDYVIKPLRIDETVARISTHVRMRLMKGRLESQFDELKRYREHLEDLVGERTAMLDETNRRLRAEIDERHAANRELQAKESLLRSLIDSIPDLIFFKDTESVYLGFNKAFAEFCGLPEEALVGKTDHAFATPELAEFFREKDLKMLTSGKPQRNEEEVAYPDGRKVLFDTMKTPLRGANGKIIGVIGISRDITERKHMEAELAQREQEYRTLAENSPNAIVRYDRECRRIYFNQAYLGLSKLSAEFLLGKTPMEHWWLAEPTAVDYTALLRRVLDSGRAEQVSMAFSKPNGDTHYGISYLVPEYDGNFEIVSVLTIAHDITHLKRMEAKLRRSEMEFRTLAENSPDMIVRYDTECRRVFINPAYERYTGVPIESAWNKTPDEVWVPLMPKEEYMARLKQVMETGEPDQILLEWYLPDGNLTSHMMHTVAEYDNHGSVVGTLVIGHNISELKATERTLQESRTQLRALTARLERAREQERKRIAREIHDELGQLLSVLRLNITMLDYRFGESNPGLAAKTESMVTTVDRAIAMVRDLASELRPAVLGAGLFSALEWLVQEFSQNTGLVVGFRVDGKEFMLDEVRSMLVFRIVQESLTNILRHSRVDNASVTMSCLHDHCCIVISDHGQGFDPKGGVSPRSLGLLGMRERALMLGGALEIDSGIGQGTQVRLSIPLEAASLPFALDS